MANKKFFYKKGVYKSYTYYYIIGINKTNLTLLTKGKIIMKFNFFSVLFHKSQRGLNSLISTKDKIEEIRYQYNKNAERYIKSAEDMLANAKELKAKFEELDAQTVANKRSYESLIEASKTDSAKLDEAKIKYITYKGMKTARDTIETAWKNTEQQCIKVRDTLKNIDTNKALIEAKLTALNVQIDTLKMCDRNVIGDFGVDCNEMIAEIEKEVQTTQFRMESKREVAELVGHSKPAAAVSNAVIDTEFQDVVNEYLSKH